MTEQPIYTATEIDTMLLKLEVKLMDDKIKTRIQLINHIFDTITDLRISLKNPLHL